MKFNYPVIDLHTHFRNDIAYHARVAEKNGINVAVYMANTNPPLDNIIAIKSLLQIRTNTTTLPVSAITENLEGKKLVDIEAIRDYVVGFSDDGVYLDELDLLAMAFKSDVLIMAHCNPKYEIGLKSPELETKYIEKYLSVLSKNGGRLHIQHVSQKKSVEVIKKAKSSGLQITCETCPHYFTFTRDGLDIKTNPPLGKNEDVEAIRQGLKDGTIDVIASDYAPLPRVTGIAEYRAFIPLSYGLVLSGVLSENQLKEKLHSNPLKILKKNAGIYLQPLVNKLETDF